MGGKLLPVLGVALLSHPRRVLGDGSGDLAAKLADLFDLSLPAADSLLAASHRQKGWLPGPTPAVRVLPVRGGPSAEQDLTYLIRIAAGGTFPLHLHRSDEVTVVLEGAVRHDDGTEQWQGEQATHPSGSRHSLQAIGDDDCLCAVRVRREG